MTAARAHVAIAGGGLAGMSAAVALADDGHRVTLLEKRPVLGGRAGSHLDASSGEWVDNCQHVLMPCCTNLLDFYRRVGVSDKIRFHPEIPFLDARGRVSILRSSALPAPFHCAPSFLRLPFLTLGDKLGIARGLAALLARSGGLPEAETAFDWLRAHGQSAAAIGSFWEPVLVSALNETLERAAVRYAAKVFVDAFLAHPRGWWLGVPSVPLGELYDEPMKRFLEARGGTVRLRDAVERLVVADGKVAEAELASGERLPADFFVVALPWRGAAELAPQGALPWTAAVLEAALEPSPITGIHLWFDRAVTDLEFAALPGREVQWFFNKSRNFGAARSSETYLQLVTSASRRWLDLSRREILDAALAELREALPRVRGAEIQKAHVLKEPAATFSPTPESERFRPEPETRLANLFIAGDWVRTGWPATMEGAVRGGYRAAEALTASAGLGRRFLVPDLAPRGLMRFLR